MYSICLPCHFLICITVNHILCINIPIRFSFHYNIILIINLKKQVASFSVLIISSWNRSIFQEDDHHESVSVDGVSYSFLVTLVNQFQWQM